MTHIRQHGPRRHDLTHSPEALWQLDGDMLDATGNGHTLTVETGNELYGVLGGLRCFYFDGPTTLWRSSADSGLLELGDMTMEMLIAWHTDDPGSGINASRYMYTHTAEGESDATNQCYGFRVLSARTFRYFAEQGASGTNIQYSGADIVGAAGQIMHYAMVRKDDDVKFFINGTARGESSGLLAPTGGGSGRFRLGGSYAAGTQIAALVSSVKFITSALSDDEIGAECRRTLG